MHILLLITAINPHDLRITEELLNKKLQVRLCKTNRIAKSKYLTARQSRIHRFKIFFKVESCFEVKSFFHSFKCLINYT